MSAGFGTIISIVIGVIFLIIRFVNKSKEEPPQAVNDRPSVSSEPVLPSFDELLQALRIDDVKKSSSQRLAVASVGAGTTQSTDKYAELHERSELSDKGRFSDYSVKADEDNFFGELLKDPDSLRNAVILSEVLNRKFE